MSELEVNGCGLSVYERGDGSDVVLVHGLGGAAREIWKHQLRELPDFHLVSFDLRGSGSSEVTPGPYTIGLLVDDLRALVEAKGLDRIALVGHSMGGSIVLAYAARYPDDVRAVVAVGAPSTLPDAARAGLAARAETVEAEGMAAVAATVAGNGVSPSFQAEQPDAFAAFVALLERNDAHGYAAQCRALVDLDLPAELPRITAPVLLLSGDKDGVSPPAATEATAALIPDSRFTIVDDCGHILPLERPEALAEAAWPFLRQHG